MKEQAGASRKVLASERGAALLISLLAVVMMTILGLVLLEVLRGGLTQAASSEARIQAEALAQKGLDDSLALIRHAVDQGNQFSADYRSKIAAVHDALGEYLPSPASSPGISTVMGFLEDSETKAARGGYSIRVIEAENKVALPLAGVITSPDSPYVYKMVIESTGNSGTQQNVSAVKKMTVYVSTINPVFRYPLSSSGNMELNGAPAIVGDVFVNAGLSVSSTANYKTNRDRKTVSDYPSLKGFVKVIGGSFKYMMDGIVKTELENGFFSRHIPFEDLSLQPAVEVDVQHIVEAKTSEDSSSAFSVRGAKPFGQPVPASGMEDYQLKNHTVDKSLKMEDRWATLNETFVLNPSESDLGGIWIYNGGLYLEKNAELVIKKGSLYIANDDPYMVAAHLGGKLELEAGEYAAIRGNVTLYDDFKLIRGVMYIDGDLRIIGNVSLNGTVYVNGNVEMKEMTSVNSTGALIVAAQGKIIMGDNTSDQEIRSFLYSNSDMELYGVKSKLDIRGGIHGNAVKLNAVRGEVKTAAAQPGEPPEFTFQSESEQRALDPSASRLRIEYDSLLYDDPPPGIPTVNNVNVYVSQIQNVN